MSKVSTAPAEPAILPSLSAMQVCIMDLAECIRDLAMVSNRQDGPHATLGGIAIGMRRVAHRIMHQNLDGFLAAEMITADALKAITRKNAPLDADKIRDFLRDPNDKKTSGG